LISPLTFAFAFGQTLTLTPALSRKRERGRAARVIDAGAALGDRDYNPFSRLREKVAAKRPDEGKPQRSSY